MYPQWTSKEKTSGQRGCTGDVEQVGSACSPGRTWGFTVSEDRSLGDHGHGATQAVEGRTGWRTQEPASRGKQGMTRTQRAPVHAS